MPWPNRRSEHDTERCPQKRALHRLDAFRTRDGCSDSEDGSGPRVRGPILGQPDADKAAEETFTYWISWPSASSAGGWRAGSVYTEAAAWVGVG